MAHHYTCWSCGRWIGREESFCFTNPPKNKKGKQYCSVEYFGGYGTGTCGECYDLYGDYKTSYKEFKKQ